MPYWSHDPKFVLEDTSSKNVVAALLNNRGIDPDDSVFTKAPLSSLSDPESLGPGASKAAYMMAACRDRRTAVIGDYDADGIIASTLVCKTIEALGGTCDVFLPSRWRHGYGLNDRTVRAFLERFRDHMPEVVFVVDCGSSSESAVSTLKNHGVQEVAVIDHHIVDADKMVRSADAHVNWRLFGTSSNLCAAGEVFQVCRLALTRAGLPWEWMLAFAAVATVGDVVPVSGDNRIIVRQGAVYNRMISSNSPGLMSLAMKRCSDGVTQKSLAFYIVPRLNAAGRVAEADVALNFLVEKDIVKASDLMNVIESANNQRKLIQDSITRECIRMLGGKRAKPSHVFLHNPKWSIGVCGISCSQLVQKFGVPVMLFGSHENAVRGSGRSIPGVNIKTLLDECGETVFERWGGHEMACGATVKGGMFSEASRKFGEAVARLGAVKPVIHRVGFDADLPIHSVTPTLGDSILETLYPYCPETNPEPVFRIQRVSVCDVQQNEYRNMTKMAILVRKEGKTLHYPMSAFVRHGIDDEKLDITEGDIVDVYFSFPQRASDGIGLGGDGEYTLEMVDVRPSVR